MVKALYVEKKPEFANRAKELIKEFKESLQIVNLTDIRVINRYLIEDLSDEAFLEAGETIFSEPPTDTSCTDMDFRKQQVIAVEYLPGQFDQRASSAEECLQFIAPDETPTVKSAVIYILEGELSNDELEKIKEYLINPVESREAALGVPATLRSKYPDPAPVATVKNFINFTDADLETYLVANSLAMDIEDLKICREYFKGLDRDPSVAEIKVIDTYWSDHCRHTTFNTTIRGVVFKDETINKTFSEYQELRKQLGVHKPISLMNVATIAVKALKENGKLVDVVESEEINACTVDFKANIDGEDQDWVLLFKNETHNHPTEIEPFGGAATCIGGAIRDPLSGRGYVYAAMRVTGSGNPLTPVSETREGKLSQKKITTTAANGYSSYGNQIGLTTGLVDEVYHEGYVAKRMEVGAVVAAAPASNIRRERPAAGDVVILLGGRTGRDGIGGATGSSKSHSLESLETCGAEVQKGNAPEERKIQRLFRNPEATTLVKRCNDFGAGGVSVAVGELADGLDVNLDNIPKKYDGLDGTELAISESQERMAVVVAAEDAEKFKQLAESENLEATEVARVTEEAYLTMSFRGQQLVNISREFLDTNGAEKEADAVIEGARRYDKEIPRDFEKGMKDLVSDLNVCSKRGLSERFDSTIGANTVLMPFGGINQRTPIQAMVHKIPMLEGECSTVSMMAYGFNPYILEQSPYHGAYLAIVESVAKLIATGASYDHIYLSLQEYFEKLGDNDKAWGKAFGAVLGAFRAQMELGIGAIGGKDSMSGTFEDIHAPPTLISFAVTTDELDKVVSPEFKRRGHEVVWLRPELGEDGLPTAESLIRNFNMVRKLVDNGLVAACYTPGFGGPAEAVFKMAMGNNIGFEFDADISMREMFGYAYGSFIIETGQNIELTADMKLLGKTVARESIGSKKGRVRLVSLCDLYEGKLEPVYSCNIETPKVSIPDMIYRTRSDAAPRNAVAKPKFLIPVFPGTNCEYDTAGAVEKAGGEAETFVVNNLTSEHLKKSVKDFAKSLSESQVLFLPGGFSGADEPDGSGKFITSFLRNEEISEELMKLLDERDGLVAGICNGFQALIKLGLLPYGEIGVQQSDSPTLTFNNIGRHQSKLVRTKVCSTKSPWLRRASVGQVLTVPISHGEGRFIANDNDIDTMLENGQILTQYVDFEGNPTMDIRFNPNGSTMAIEGILSPDGRILGKMGHSERIGKGLYKNVPGEFELGMFESAVSYFSCEE